MSKQVVFAVIDDRVTLQKQLGKCSSLKQEKKVRMLLAFLNDSSTDQTVLCTQLAITLRTLQRWKRNYVLQGLEQFASLPKRKRTSSKVSAQLHDALQAKVHDTEDPLLGYWHAVEWVREQHGVELHYKQLRKYLITHFGTKVKRGRKSHVKKEEQAEATFLKSCPSASGR